MIKHTKKAILSSIIQTFISNFIGENIYIKSLNKFQQLYQNSYNNFIINDISLKVLSKFTNILSILKLLYLDFSAEKLKYESIYGNVRIVRAPPVTL